MDLFYLLLCAMVSTSVIAFSPLTRDPLVQRCSTSRKDPSKKTQALSALTERQMQFWEDVEDGLDDIEKVFKEKGESIERIRDFGRSARFETAPPDGYAIGHQPSEEHVDGLTAKPFWDAVSDPTNFPWAAELESKSSIIIDEFESKLMRDEAKSSSSGQQLFSGDSAWQNAVMGTGWSAFRLQRLGVWNTDNCKEFPATYELLRSLDIPFAVRGVCFARQNPGSGVSPHSDGRNFILTSHLGLRIPEGCWMKVGEEEKSWSEGKLTTIDTSFEHSTGNPTKEDRHVLIIDFWHPELTEAERACLEFIYDLRNKFERGEVPYRRPRALLEKDKDKEGGLGGLWKSLTGN